MLTSNRFAILLLLIACVFTGCFTSSTENIVDDYQITWVDTQQQRAIYKHEKIIPPYVYAVGYTPRFIIAKQHPLQQGSQHRINTAVTNYYVIERTKNFFQDKPLYGPLTETDYNNLCRWLQINSVRFTKNYPTHFKQTLAAN